MERTPPLFVSVIVPVKNDAKRLSLCLAALSRQTYSADHFEVLVCNSASADHPERFLRECAQARIVSCDAHDGRAAARNRGIGVARGDVLAFTDADCVPDRKWLEEGVRAIASAQGPIVVGGRILVSAQDALHPSAMETYDAIVNFRQKQYIDSYFFCATANMFVHMSTMKKVGLFDAEHFDGYGGEDRDWGLRAHAMGCPLRYAVSVDVTHPAQRSIMTFLRKYAMIVESSFSIRQKHGRVGYTPSLVKRILKPESRLRLLVSHSGKVPMSMFIALLGLHASECAVHAFVSLKCSVRNLRPIAASRRCP